MKPWNNLSVPWRLKLHEIKLHEMFFPLKAFGKQNLTCFGNHILLSPRKVRVHPLWNTRKQLLPSFVHGNLNFQLWFGKRLRSGFGMFGKRLDSGEILKENVRETVFEILRNAYYEYCTCSPCLRLCDQWFDRLIFAT